MKRTRTAEEKRIMKRVAAMGCIVCESMGFHGTPSQVHHVRANHGWGREQFQDLYGKSEIEFLEIVLNRLMEAK